MAFEGDFYITNCYGLLAAHASILFLHCCRDVFGHGALGLNPGGRVPSFPDYGKTRSLSTVTNSINQLKCTIQSVLF